MSRVENPPTSPTPAEANVEWLPLPDEYTDMGAGQKLVYIALTEVEGASGKELLEALALSPGTVYPALHTLEERGLAERRPTLDGNLEYWTLIDEPRGGDGE